MKLNSSFFLIKNLQGELKMETIYLREGREKSKKSWKERFG